MIRRRNIETINAAKRSVKLVGPCFQAQPSINDLMYSISQLCSQFEALVEKETRIELSIKYFEINEYTAESRNPVLFYVWDGHHFEPRCINYSHDIGY